jgi:hypothetical protein
VYEFIDAHQSQRPNLREWALSKLDKFGNENIERALALVVIIQQLLVVFADFAQRRHSTFLSHLGDISTPIAHQIDQVRQKLWPCKYSTTLDNFSNDNSCIASDQSILVLERKW